MMKLEGIYAPLPTPFKEAGEEISVSAFTENLEKWAGSSLTGVVVSGSNGELPFLSPDERALLVKTAKDVFSAAGSDKKIIAGTFMNTTKETVACCKSSADAGADAALLLPPHYFKGQGMPAAARFFESVADASPIPVVLYNMPANTGVNMDTDTILDLAKHPNIIGIKDTSGDMTKVCYLSAAQTEKFSVFCGSGNYFLPALSLGAMGGTLAVANLYPEACRKLLDAYRANRMDEARGLQHRIMLASDALTRRFGIPGLKAATDRAGMYGGPCRPPMMPLDEASRGKLFEALEKADLESFETWRA